MNKLLKKTIEFFKGSEWIGLSAILFLVYQFLISFLLWNRTGDIPPGFGDAYSYIFGINKLIVHHTLFPHVPYLNFSEHFTYLGYNLFMGLTGLIFGMSGEQVLYASFFFGKIFLLAALLFFLTRLFHEKKALVAISLACLAVFVGNGAIHGFFWVVPSFWMVVVFFVLWGMIFDTREYVWWVVFLISLFYITIHPMAIYSVSIFLTFTFLAFLFHQEIWKRALRFSLYLLTAATIVQAVVYFSPVFSGYFSHETPSVRKVEEVEVTKSINSVWSFRSSGVDVETKTGGIQNTIPRISTPFADDFVESNRERITGIFPSFIKVWNSYFSWFFRLPPLLLMLVLSYYLAIKRRRYNLTLLFSSSMFFTLAALVHPSGDRSIIFLFPLTFVLFASGIYDAFFLLKNFTEQHVKKYWGVIRYIYFFAVTVGLLLVAAYGILSVREYSSLADYTVGTTCTKKILKTDSATTRVYFSSVEGINYFLSKGLDFYDIRGINSCTKSLISEGNKENYFLLENEEMMKKNGIDMRLVDDQKLSKIRDWLNDNSAERTSCGIFTLYGPVRMVK